MVSGLKFFAEDPQRGMDRGRGQYYYRGALMQPNGRRKKTWSKYNEAKDGALYHKRKKVPPQNVKRKEQKQPHKADYKTKGRGASKMSPRLSGSRKGYF